MEIHDSPTLGERHRSSVELVAEKLQIVEADGFIGKTLRPAIDQKRVNQNGDVILLRKYDSPLVLRY